MSDDVPQDTPKRRKPQELAGDLTATQIAVIAALVIGVLVVALWLKRPAHGGGGRARVVSVPVVHAPQEDERDDGDGAFDYDDTGLEYAEL